MFDIFPKALSSVASFLFPLFASYKALKTSDPAQLTPWLMYWVVLACALLVESWLDWFLVWIPFYAYMRLLFLLYLVLPQTQGARHLYQTQIHPFLDDNEAAIEDFIASAHDRLRAAGIAYLKQAIEALRTRLLGLPPSPEQEAAAAGVQNARAAPQSYTQNLLARFSLPAARWSGNAGAGAANAGQDFYSLLAGAVSAAATGLAGAAGATGAQTGLAGMAGSGSLIPDNIGESERADFIATQRERLSMLMRALDREAAQMGSARAAGAATGSEQPRFGDPWSQGDREQTPTASGTGGLTKSRSEAEFEKIEAESGEEGEQVRKRGTPGTGGGSWMPWGWSGGGDTGKSSGVEK